MSHKSSEILKKLFPPTAETPHAKDRIALAARTLGWEYSRTYTLWYATARRIDADEMDQLRAEQARTKQKEFAHDYEDFRRRLERIEALLAREMADEADELDREEALPVGLRAA
jgi:nucleotidyltransferase/DNA polymerase involved in DNA repair